MKIAEFKKLIREEVRKVIKEANAPALSLKPGSTIDDWELVNKKIIKPKHEEDWLVLFSDEIELNPKSSASRKKYVNMANTWLKDNGYTWKVADALSQNEDGEITWKIA